MSKEKLTELEMQILWGVADDLSTLQWGKEHVMALVALRRHGYIRAKFGGGLTEKGRKAIQPTIDDTIETLRAKLAEAERERDEVAEQVKLLQKDALCSMLRMTWRMHDSALAENEKLRDALTELLAAVDRLFPNDGPLKIQARAALASSASLETINPGDPVNSTPAPAQGDKP